MKTFDAEQRQQVLDWLSAHVPKSRLKHILRVEKMAIALAQAHNLSPTKAAQAGIMHDLAKYYAAERLLEMAAANHIEIDSIFEANPHLLHADVGAIIARDEFGVTDPDVLAAIANHTLGQPGMSALSCVIFLADSLEPGRGKMKELNVLRDMSQHSLCEAVWMTCDYTINHLIRTHRLIHPRALQTRNWFLRSAKNRATATKHPLECSTSNPDNGVSP